MDKKTAQIYAWRAKNRDYYNAYMRNYRNTHPEWWKGVKRKAVLKKYGLTMEELESHLECQEYKCKICRRDLHDGKGGMAVDHNHETQAFRGILCTQCNAILGMAHDDIAILQNAIEYLK